MKTEKKDLTVQNVEMIPGDYVSYRESPYTMINTKTGWRITVGNDIVSDKIFESKQDAIKYIKSKPYDLIYTTVIFFINKINSTK